MLPLDAELAHFDARGVGRVGAVLDEDGDQIRIVGIGRGLGVAATGSGRDESQRRKGAHEESAGDESGKNGGNFRHSIAPMFGAAPCGPLLPPGKSNGRAKIRYGTHP